MRVVIIGPRSIGKSTVGEVLARKLGVRYLDFDAYVDSKLQGIAQHIRLHGVESYRVREGGLLASFVSELPEHCVVSVGGGTIASQFEEVRRRNARLLESVGELVSLSPEGDTGAAAEMLLVRERSRGGDKGFQELRKLLEMRRPFYEKVCDLEVKVSGDASPSALADDIIRKMTKW